MVPQWTPIKYKVGFDLEGGSGSFSDKTWTFDTKYTVAEPAKEGYTFLGWTVSGDATGWAEYSDTKSGTYHAMSSTTPAKNSTAGKAIYVRNLSTDASKKTTLVANWTPGTYTLRFDANAADATGYMDIQTIYIGTTANIWLNAYDRVGHSFSGWATDPDGPVVYANGQAVTNIAPKDSVLTLYAVWRNAETGEREEESAYISRLDSQGWANPFRDLEEDSRWYSAVRHLFQRGLLCGVEENRFGVSSPFSLAQVLALLHRAAGSPEYTGVTLPYADVQEGDWYDNAVCWAWQLGILPQGSSLQPDTRLTRDVFIAGLYAWAVNTGSSDPVPEGNGTLLLLRSLLAERGLSTDTVSAEALTWAIRSGLLRAGGLTVPQVLSGCPVTRLEGCGLVSLYLERNGR